MVRDRVIKKGLGLGSWLGSGIEFEKKGLGLELEKKKKRVR